MPDHRLCWLLSAAVLLMLPSGRAQCNPRTDAAIARLLNPKVVRAEALRDAAHSAIALRASSTIEGDQAALSKVFDGTRATAAAAASRGRYNRRNRLPLDYSQLLEHTMSPSGPAQLRAAAAQPSVPERIQASVSTAFGPFRALLEYAWGGQWTGAALLHSVDGSG
ncbi:MAG: hypothetical protein ABIJ96_10785 [Elusimicrobiota bacterium]